MDTDFESQVAALYVAMFNRAPDSAGLESWSKVLSGGSSLALLADAMFATDPARAFFPASLSNEQIVTAVYLHALGRAPDAEGLAFWTAQMGKPGATPGSVVAGIVETASNYTGWDPAGLLSAATFQARVAMAKSFVESDGALPRAQALFAATTQTDPPLVLPPGTAGTVDATGFHNVQLGLVADDVTIDGLTSGARVTLTASPQVAPVYTPGDAFSDYHDLSLPITGSDGGDGYDFLTLSLASQDAIEAHVHVWGVQNLHIESLDTDADPHSNLLRVDNGYNSGQGLQAIRITGNAGLSLEIPRWSAAELKFIDASEARGDITVFSFAWAITIVGGQGDDQLDTTQSGGDIMLFGGAGNDTLSVSGDSLSKLVGGAGADTFKVGSSHGDDYRTTIADFNLAEGDRLAGAAGSAAQWHADKVQLGPAATYHDYLDAATKYAASTYAQQISWFQFGGDTYVVYDNNASSVFSTDNGFHVDPNGNPYYAKPDAVVKLVGLVDLSGAAATDGVIGPANPHPGT